MNRWTGTGHLTKDVELKYSKNGTAIATGTIGVRRKFDKDKSDFINIKVLGPSAEKYFAEYGRKGRLIGVDGELHINTWKDEEGNWNRYTEVVGNVEFLDKDKNKTTTVDTQTPYGEDLTPIGDESELPF